ncbi:MAG TPA: endonuclease/exonuclease/phosphatase family protein [Bacteroidales bacterium]|nr:endonuclease/exonuclease/phosphatase family protein [Bacteroidales bacterium]
MMKRGLTLALVLVAGLLANAQDTIKMMQYNLLYYGNYPEWCTETDNDMNNKADYIATIIDHVKPDIFTVNEMDGSNYAAGHLLGNALNIDGTTYYSMSYPGSDYLINMMYYNSNKLELTDHYVVGTEVRDIDIYVMRSLQTADPVDFNVAVAHLKAGNEDSDAVSRANMTDDFMTYLSGFSNQTNWIFAGDLNLYTSSEQAYQNLVNPSQGSITFTDPVNEEGDWHTNYSYRNYHTQSTHTPYDQCPSGGGLDDRFDFILVSGDVLSGTNDFTYVLNSYKTLGQDGSHYNTSLIDGNNSSAPSSVIEALYNNSDHLPVIAKFAVGESSGIADVAATGNLKVSSIETRNGNISFTLEQSKISNGNAELFTLTGRKLSVIEFEANRKQRINVPCSQNGMLFVRISTERGDRKVFRVVK